LTHFGTAADPAAQLERLRESLRRNAERAHRGDRDAYLAEVRAEVEAKAAPGTAASLLQAVPLEQTWLGLDRYWRKRSSGGG
jgi:hypothetical protein